MKKKTDKVNIEVCKHIVDNRGCEEKPKVDPWVEITINQALELLMQGPIVCQATDDLNDEEWINIHLTGVSCRDNTFEVEIDEDYWWSEKCRVKESVLKEKGAL